LASTTVIAPQLAFVVNIPKITLAAWNASLSEQAQFKQHIATAITTGQHVNLALVPKSCEPGLGDCTTTRLDVLAGNPLRACAAQKSDSDGGFVRPAGRVLVQVDPATSALRGINVPTYVQFLEDETDPSNANEFFYNLLEQSSGIDKLAAECTLHNAAYH